MNYIYLVTNTVNGKQYIAKQFVLLLIVGQDMFQQVKRSKTTIIFITLLENMEENLLRSLH